MIIERNAYHVKTTINFGTKETMKKSVLIIPIIASIFSSYASAANIVISNDSNAAVSFQLDGDTAISGTTVELDKTSSAIVGCSAGSEIGMQVISNSDNAIYTLVCGQDVTLTNHTGMLLK